MYFDFDLIKQGGDETAELRVSLPGGLRLRELRECQASVGMDDVVSVLLAH